jgi:hypothetical protein
MDESLDPHLRAQSTEISATLVALLREISERPRLGTWWALVGSGIEWDTDRVRLTFHLEGGLRSDEARGIDQESGS